MITNIVIGVLLLSVVLSSIRLLLGPTSQDRILALDVLTVQISAYITYWAMVEKNGGYLDIVLVVAAAVFLVTTLYARFLEKGIK